MGTPAKAVVPADNPPSNNLPSNVDYSVFATGETGFENVTDKDLIIPRLTILQALSPQLSRGKPEYDPEAKVGDIYDIGFRERFPDGIQFIVAYFSKAYLEWAPRESGGGLKGIHDERILNQAERNEKGKPFLSNGNFISETAQFYGLNVTAGFRKSFLPMASTQLKKGRQLLSAATSLKLNRPDGSEYTPSLWYRAYKLTTVDEGNNLGSWMGWKIEPGQPLPEFPNWEQHLAEIKEFRQSCIKGETRGDLSGVEGEQHRNHDSYDAPF